MSTRQEALVSIAGATAEMQRPSVRGRFLYVGDTKFWVRGVTYGTFRPDENGDEFRDRDVVIGDFAAMAEAGINTVRTYSVPPVWLLELASDFGLRVMVGIPWSQHVAFLDQPRLADRIEDEVRAGVRRCERHPAILCYVIGNEIPSSIVRWSGRRRVERFIRRLYRCAKREDPDALVTYVNFPSTEYLQLPFLDLVSFNIYLESRDEYESYLARLHNLASPRPLLLAEAGLDSQRHGEEAQARVLAEQVESAYRSGCSGVVVFAWTDEWYRGGYDIADWSFGLTTRERNAKPALTAVTRAFANVPFAQDMHWPKVSVVVCSFNGAATIRDTLDGLASLDYPDYEVIVVDDGSTDPTADIAGRYDVRLIRTTNNGLSSARNEGIQAAEGNIVAFIDDDAYPDPHWLRYLATTFADYEFAGVGGPNLAPAGDGAIAECVANAPGGPVEVLLTDTLAEHIPGCNMAFRRDALLEIGGFDPVYRAAGDDVDLSWRLQDHGYTIGFNAAAVVWHHRRNSVRTYWRQQVGYGKAEAMLERKWPERYNALGHTSWAGRLYGSGITAHLGSLLGRMYQGVWGSAPFQALYRPAAGTLLALPLMPEWYLLVSILILVAIVSPDWLPAELPWSLAGVALLLPIVQAGISAGRARFRQPAGRMRRLMLYALTAVLHVVQPVARLVGRLRHGLTIWRRRGPAHGLRIRPVQLAYWREDAVDPCELMDSLAAAIRRRGAVVSTGGDFDDWDLEVRGGLLGAARVLAAHEDHEGGRQLVRARVWPRYGMSAVVLFVLLALPGLVSALSGELLSVTAFATASAVVVWRSIVEAGRAAGVVCGAAGVLGSALQEPEGDAEGGGQ